MGTVSLTRTTSTLQELLADLPDGDVIPMPFIRDRVSWTRDAQSKAVREGLIRPLPDRHGAGGSYLVSRDDAVEILVAAALAFLAGCAVIAMLRGIQGAGLDAQVLARAMK